MLKGSWKLTGGRTVWFVYHAVRGTFYSEAEKCSSTRPLVQDAPDLPTLMSQTAVLIPDVIAGRFDAIIPA